MGGALDAEVEVAEEDNATDGEDNNNAAAVIPVNIYTGFQHMVAEDFSWAQATEKG
jgi:hypothetical protein